MQILFVLGIYFDAVVVEVEKCSLFFKLALAGQSHDHTVLYFILPVMVY